MSVGSAFDVFPSREARTIEREDAILIIRIGAWRYDAVGRKNNRPVKACKFLLLLPPSVPIVSYQMCVLFQLRIIVSRKHFAVRIDVDAHPFRLLQQVFEIVQVVPADQNPGVAPHAQIYFCDYRRTISRRIGFVEQGHSFDARLSRAQHEIYQRSLIRLRICHDSQGLRHKTNQRKIRLLQV